MNLNPWSFSLSKVTGYSEKGNPGTQGRSKGANISHPQNQYVRWNPGHQHIFWASTCHCMKKLLSTRCLPIAREVDKRSRRIVCRMIARFWLDYSLCQLRSNIALHIAHPLRNHHQVRAYVRASWLAKFLTLDHFQESSNQSLTRSPKRPAYQDLWRDVIRTNTKITGQIPVVYRFIDLSVIIVESAETVLITSRPFDPLIPEMCTQVRSSYYQLPSSTRDA